MAKGLNFVPTPYDINWYTLKQDFDNFVNKLRFHYLNATSTVTSTTDNNKQALDESALKKVEKKSNFRVKTASSHNLEAFIEKIEHIIFQPLNRNKTIFHNSSIVIEDTSTLLLFLSTNLNN